MESRYIEEKMELIKDLEFRKERNQINEKVIQELWELVKRGYDSYIVREKYKKILEESNKYNNNYYSKICIILNVMESKKEDLKEKTELISFNDLQYIKQRIAGEVITNIGKKSTVTRYVLKKVEYEDIQYREGIGTKATEKTLRKIEKEAQEILKEETLDLERAKKWVKLYRKYVIQTYGRWSKEYEKYMNTTFEIPIILTSPNILLLAMRETMKKGIKSVVEKN